MKVLKLHSELEKLIKQAQTHDRVAQYRLYEKFSPKMLSVCRYYIKDLQHAEDVLQKGFCKVFLNIKTYEFKGSFEGWVRRIMVRQSIDFLRQKKSIMISTDSFDHYALQDNPMNEVEDVTHIQEAIDQLPDGYKTVFCLYVIEEYKHKDIAEMLNIDVGTSKSQLYKARKMLKENLQHLNLKQTQ